jgi:hypothetical protein
MNLKPVQLGGRDEEAVKFFLIEEPARVLVAAFSGEASDTREHHGMYALMEAMIAEGYREWKPDGIILDFSDLTYEDGHDMARTLGFAEDAGGGKGLLPVGIIVSGLNRSGLMSLMIDHMEADPAEWMFEDVPAAFKSIQARLSANS